MKQYAAKKNPNMKFSYKKSEATDSVGVVSNLESSVKHSTSEEEDEEDDDSKSFLDDDFEEEEKTTTNKYGTKSNKGTDFMSRKNSMMSRRGGGGIRKDLKRMNTNISRMSRTSRVSKGSGKSMISTRSRARSSSKRYQGGFFSHYSEQNEEEEKAHPFDLIFGKDIYKKMKANKDYVEKMSFTEFKLQVQWADNVFPQFVVDLIAYISGFLLEEYIKQKKV